MTTRSLDRMIQLAETAMFQAELVDPARREALLTEAKDALMQAEMLSPGRGSWLLACVNARLGNTALVQRWLERAQTNDALPGREKVATSAYMAGLRSEAWFKEIVDRLE